MPRRFELPNAELQARYLNGESSVRLAASYGCSPTTIAKRLRADGVVMRPSRFNPLPVPEAALRRLYLHERLPVMAIAQHFGVSTSTINNKRRHYGIAARPRLRRSVTG